MSYCDRCSQPHLSTDPRHFLLPSLHKSRCGFLDLHHRHPLSSDGRFLCSQQRCCRPVRAVLHRFPRRLVDQKVFCRPSSQCCRLYDVRCVASGELTGNAYVLVRPTWNQRLFGPELVPPPQPLDSRPQDRPIDYDGNDGMQRSLGHGEEKALLWSCYFEIGLGSLVAGSYRLTDEIFGASELS